MTARYELEDLVRFAATLLIACGLDEAKARTTARLLVEADMIGHTTHGLALLAGYLKALASGTMARSGEPTVEVDKGAIETWDGHHLPGLWLTDRAIDRAIAKAREHGTGTIAIRRSHHIGCLAAFLTHATDQGLMLLLGSSDPAVATVAPFGGRLPLFTPNPMAVGIPTGGDPILIDISASITTNGLSNRLAAAGLPGDHAWWLDADGNPTRDSAVINADPPGTILPVGGLDHGHKGFALAIMLEALTQALSGYGRADAPTDWGASVFVQALDPAVFGSRAEFERQTRWLADACRANPTRPGVEAVRMPGDQAALRRRDALAHGVPLHPAILPGLEERAREHGVPLPVARDS